jgi:hypothetical protein
LTSMTFYDKILGRWIHGQFRPSSTYTVNDGKLKIKYTKELL